MKKYVFLIPLLWATSSNADTCDCSTHFHWVKKTIEENDAGFAHAIEVKGEAAYAEHNKKFEARITNTTSLEECASVLSDWLRFFRSGHLSIRLNEATASANEAVNNNKEPTRTLDNYSFNPKAFRTYLVKHRLDDYEGIWDDGQRRIGIKKLDENYLGFVVESSMPSWARGEVVVQLNLNHSNNKSVYYDLERKPVSSNLVRLIGKNHLQLGDVMLKRVSPIIEEEGRFDFYIRSLQAQKPYMLYWDSTTLYLRIPTFDGRQKPVIDSLLDAFRDQMLATKNLIIDIRDNRGGSDASYSEIIPFLYTNVIRTVGVEYYSTPLNNQRMLDFVHDTIYGLTDEVKHWAEESYVVLQTRLGEFVNLRPNTVSELKLDTVYEYPKNVAILINNRNASTAEQFLLAAKQSRKVKTFGTTTFGALDFSNMYFVDAPCKELKLGYCLTRSMRLPEFSIDDIGIQPDYFLDDSIPPHEWVEYVHRVLSDR